MQTDIPSHHTRICFFFLDAGDPSSCSASACAWCDRLAASAEGEGEGEGKGGTGETNTWKSPLVEATLAADKDGGRGSPLAVGMHAVAPAPAQ